MHVLDFCSLLKYQLEMFRWLKVTLQGFDANSRETNFMNISRGKSTTIRFEREARVG